MITKIISALSFLLPSPVTCMIYRLLGHKIGKNVKIPMFSYIHADEIELGNDVDIRPFIYINVAKLSLGNNSIISFGTQIKGDKSFYAKDNSFIGPQCLIHCDEDVKIGFYSGLGPRCTVYTHGSFLPVTKGYPVKFAEVVLEDYVMTGMGVLYLPGAYIESNCIINSGAVLGARVKSNSIVQLDSNVVRKLDLAKLQRVYKKDNAFYHEEILEEFLEYCKLKYQHNKAKSSFAVGEDFIFKYFPEGNTITLLYKNKNITYDLENFYADYSNLKIHKKFLYFVRRRFGITLRIKY